MRQRLGSHLSYANVMVTLLAFVVLGGGSALASVIITSNSQLAKNTISGHNPPSGKHSNIIARSVNGPDVQNLHFQPLTLKNGWDADCFGGGVPAIARSAEGVVYFRGDMCQDTGGLPNNAFTVPTGFEPAKFEEMPIVDGLSNGATGGLQINPGGQAYVRTPHSTAGRNISLAGVSYTLPY